MTTPNYDESSATATAVPYRRVRYVGIWNDPGGTARCEMQEADTLIVNGKKIHVQEGAGQLSESLDLTDDAKLDEPFQLRDPATNALIPGLFGTRRQILGLLYGYAGHLREVRDAQVPN
jgi:hypothetical protein